MTLKCKNPIFMATPNLSHPWWQTQLSCFSFRPLTSFLSLQGCLWLWVPIVQFSRRQHLTPQHGHKTSRRAPSSISRHLGIWMLKDADAHTYSFCIYTLKSIKRRKFYLLQLIHQPWVRLKNKLLCLEEHLSLCAMLGKGATAGWCQFCSTGLVH